MPAAIPLAAAAVGGLATYAAGNAASRSTDRASDRATAFQREALNTQTALSAPYRAFGESGVSRLARLLGLSDPTTSAARSNLVPLAGLSTTGQHSKQTNTKGPLGINTFGTTPLISGTSPSTREGPDGSTSLFYDRTTGRIVDGMGNQISDANGEGVIQGVLSGFNNPVRRDAQGNLYAQGSKGEGRLNLNLSRLTPEEIAAQQPQATTSGGTSQILDELRQMPGYQFRLAEGTRAARNAASTMGMTLSGNTLRGITEFGTGLADNYYQNEVNNLMGVVGLGQAAAAGQAANVGATGVNLGNIASQQGANQAGIATNTIAGITGALSNAANNYYTAQTLQGLMQPGGSFAPAANTSSPGGGWDPSLGVS